MIHQAALAEESVWREQTEHGGAAEASGARKAGTCSYQKYKKVERSLMVYIRSHEGQAGEGLSQQDVVEWYLNQQEQLDNTGKLAAERKLVRRIIQRLIHTDKVLFVVQDTGGHSVDSRLISVALNISEDT